MTGAERLSLERIAHAAGLIDPVFLDSPQYRAASLDAALDCRLVVKVETLNPIRSFKGRGTEYLTACLDGRPHLVCATAGNFGQGMAYSAHKREIPLTVFAALNASPMKVERMRTLGAEVRLAGEDFEGAHEAATIFATERGAQLIEDGRAPAIAEGAGTIAVELLRWPEPFDAIVVPVGDGALLAGIGRWVKAHQPQAQLIGVCASGAPAMELSWRQGAVLEIGRAHTIADGIAIRVPFAEALGDLQASVDDFILVEDDDLVTAMRVALEELGLVLEPAGAAGLAAVLCGRERFSGRTIATVLTGGNITPAQMQRWLSVS
jgi:threonine dehydratase